MTDRIDLVSGVAPWLLYLQGLAAVAAGVVVLASPSTWAWRLLALGALALVTVAVFRQTARVHSRGSLLVHLDGILRLEANGKETDGLADGAAWLSRWLCVLHWTPLEGGFRRHSLVCASLNSDDDYRRLLVWLRLGAFDAREGVSA